MYSNKINVIALFVLSVFFFQSCADEFSDLSSQSFTNNKNDRPDDPKKGPSTKIVTDWMDLFLELERYAGGMRPNASARAIAYINLAAYETAIPSFRGLNSNVDRIRGLSLENNFNDEQINFELALNRTYSKVIDHFLLNLPDEKRSEIKVLENHISEQYTNTNNSFSLQETLDWSNYVSNQVIEFSQTDSNAESQILDPQPSSYIPPTGPGFWTFSAEPERALFPYWGNVRTFIVDTDRTSTIPPIEYSSNTESPYYKEMKEVYLSNNSAKAENNQDLWVAEFWSDDVETITFSPPARQISIATQLIKKEKSNLEDALYLYLKLGFALNDAAVSTWKYKYEHMVMRPSVYIQNYIDENYQTNLYRLIPWPNPTFPSYPSGHSAFASAAGGVFIEFYGDVIRFTDRSHEGRTEFRGKPRTFSSFTEMAAENGYSRIPLGVHMRIDCTEGLRLGYEISDGVNEYNLRKRKS